MLKRAFFVSILLMTFADPATAKNTILHCHGYQPDDHHKLTDQIITLDPENKVVLSIQLDGLGPKDVINAPIKHASKNVLQWSYDKIRKEYFFDQENSRLRLFTDNMILLGIFDCTTS